MLPLRDGALQAFERNPVPLSGDWDRVGWIVGWCRYRFRSVLAARPVCEVPARDLPPAARVYLLHECRTRSYHPDLRPVPAPGADLLAAAA